MLIQMGQRVNVLLSAFKLHKVVYIRLLSRKKRMKKEAGIMDSLTVYPTGANGYSMDNRILNSDKQAGGNRYKSEAY